MCITMPKLMFAILVLESRRNRCVIIGEDLGTVPDEARHLLNRYQVFSYKVMYFSKGWNGFQLPEEYPEQAITVISTHDVAPLAGYWIGKDWIRCSDSVLCLMQPLFRRPWMKREHE